MIREINELILLLDKNETGFTLYRVFGKSGTVDIADRKKDHTNKDIEMGFDQRELMETAIKEFFGDYPFEIIKDINGKDRMLFIYYNLK